MMSEANREIFQKAESEGVIFPQDVFNKLELGSKMYREGTQKMQVRIGYDKQILEGYIIGATRNHYGHELFDRFKIHFLKPADPESPNLDCFAKNVKLLEIFEKDKYVVIFRR